MALTVAQQTFLDNYVRKHPIKGRSKKKRAANFDPARDAAVQQLALMQAVPGYAGFQGELAAIDLQAEALKFDRATDAADDLTLRMKQAQVDFMNNGVGEVATAINAINVLRPLALHEDVDDRIKVGGKAEVVLTALALIPVTDLVAPDLRDPTSDAARGVTDWAGATANRIQNKRRAITAAKVLLAEMNKSLVELRTKTTAAHNATTQVVAKLDALTQSWLPTVPQTPLTQAKSLYDAKVPQDARMLPMIDPTTPRIIPPVPVIDAPAAVMANRVTLAINTLQNQLTNAEQQLTQAMQTLLTQVPKNSPAFEGATDALNLLQLAPALNKPVNPPKDFDTAGFFAGPLANPGTPITTASQFAAQETAAERALLAAVQQQGLAATSDEVFDLKLKTMKDFLNEYCAAVNWNPTALDPQQKAKAMAVAQGCLKAVRTLGADRIAGKGQPVTLGGQQYVNGKFLAQGGLGEVWEYEDATDPTKKIVLKNALRATDDDRADLQKEIKAHRQLLKQPAGTPGRDNIVDMKGAIVGDDGQLYFAMEMVGGGDLEQNRTGTTVASEVGALPEQIRQLLNQRAAKQAIEGLMYMRDQNAVHFDIKGANIMIGDDGTVKVADFGSTSFGATTGGAVPKKKMGNTTKGYEAPERVDATDKSHQFDTYSIGKVMEIMQTSSDAPGEKSELTGSLKRLQEAMTHPDPAQRPSLEGVLATSHFKNLEKYDEAKLKQLTKLNSEYTKSLATDGPAVFNQFMANDLAKTGALSFAPNDYKELIGISKETLRLRETKRRELVAEKENPLTDPTRVTAIDVETKKIAGEMTVLRGIPKRFGQSPASKLIAEQIRLLSAELMEEGRRKG